MKNFDADDRVNATLEFMSSLNITGIDANDVAGMHMKAQHDIKMEKLVNSAIVAFERKSFRF